MAEVAGRLGMTTHSLYAWKMKYGPNAAEHQEKTAVEVENKRLKKELRRVTEERDILKRAGGVLCQPARVRYTFIRSHNASWPVRWLCRLLDVHPSGYYAWCQRPRSTRQLEDERLTGLIKQFWLESGGVYGYRKIHRDLRDIGERCGKHRVRRLMRLAGLRAQVGYRRPRHRSGSSKCCRTEPTATTVYRRRTQPGLGE